MNKIKPGDRFQSYGYDRCQDCGHPEHSIYVQCFICTCQKHTGPVFNKDNQLESGQYEIEEGASQ